MHSLSLTHIWYKLWSKQEPSQLMCKHRCPRTNTKTLCFSMLLSGLTYLEGPGTFLGGQGVPHPVLPHYE